MLYVSSNTGCQCVPDFLMAMVMQAPAGRLVGSSFESLVIFSVCSSLTEAVGK